MPTPFPACRFPVVVPVGCGFQLPPPPGRYCTCTLPAVTTLRFTFHTVPFSFSFLDLITAIYHYLRSWFPFLRSAFSCRVTLILFLSPHHSRLFDYRLFTFWFLFLFDYGDSIPTDSSTAIWCGPLSVTYLHHVTFRLPYITFYYWFLGCSVRFRVHTTFPLHTSTVPVRSTGPVDLRSPRG